MKVNPTQVYEHMGRPVESTSPSVNKSAHSLYLNKDPDKDDFRRS